MAGLPGYVECRMLHVVRTSSACRRLHAVHCMLHVVCRVPSVATERADADLLMAGMDSASAAGARTHACTTPGTARGRSVRAPSVERAAGRGVLLYDSTPYDQRTNGTREYPLR